MHLLILASMVHNILVNVKYSQDVACILTGIISGVAMHTYHRAEHDTC
jgi:hypothetical protein